MLRTTMVFFSIVIGNVDTFLKCPVFGTDVTFLTVSLDISVTFFWKKLQAQEQKISK